MLVAVPWQTVWAGGVAVTVEVGCTVTSKVNGTPGQKVGAGPVGVIMYLTIPAEVPVLSNVLLITLPQPELQSLKPVMVPPKGLVNTDAVQVKVVAAVADRIV